MKRNFLIKCVSVFAITCMFLGCDEINEYSFDKVVYLDYTSLALYHGDEQQIVASPGDERNAVQWTSENETIATVSSTGMVKAVGVGETRIFASLGTGRAELPVTVTIPTVDKVIVVGENGRLQVILQTFTERIKSARIIWGDGNDSIDVDINNSVGIFTRIVEYSRDDGNIIFHVVSFDKSGNRSVPLEINAVLIRNRDVTSAGALDDGALTVQWGGNTQYVEYCQLSYVNHNGVTVIQKVLPSTTTTVITDYSADLSYTTLFLISPATDTLRVGTVSPPVVESMPFKGPHILSADSPCEIEARNFDYGGEGLAFHEVSGRSPNSSYRTNEGDNLSTTVDIEGGGNLGYIGDGEWLVYTVDVKDAGVYAVEDVYLAVEGRPTGSFYFSVDGNRSETVAVPYTGGWTAYRHAFEEYPDLTQPTFRLSAGKHKIRFTVGPGGFNLMSFKFTYRGN
jgi:hypothetical protein